MSKQPRAASASCERGPRPRAVREIPIPPELVKILRTHLEEFGAAPNGRLFRNERDGVLGAFTYSRAWEQARRLAFGVTVISLRVISLR